MITYIVDLIIPNAEYLQFTDDTLTVALNDGRTISVPLKWFPRLVHAEPRERDNWRLIGGGQGIHRPDLDEDLNVEGLLAGRKSGESLASFKRWLDAKRAGLGVTLYEIDERRAARDPSLEASAP